MVPDLPLLVDVPACVVHGECFAELRHDAAGTPLPAPAGTHPALALSNGDAVSRYFVVLNQSICHWASLRLYSPSV